MYIMLIVERFNHKTVIFVAIFSQMNRNNNFLYHLLAVFTVIIWGTTFVSTKVLIGNGLSPIEIFFYRFVLAYICIWIISPRVLFAKSFKDELLLFTMGLTGGSIYFIVENTALSITLASNVSLIISTTPILTTLVLLVFRKIKKPTIYFIIGSVIALFGVALVVYNGGFVLKISPLGDILTLLAALIWALYSLTLKHLENRYSTLFITRKVFFYGIITVIPMFLIESISFDLTIMTKPTVILNLLFLGIIASMLCYITWNTTVKRLGVIKTTNYIYFIPPVTIITSSIAINESITTITIVGSILILFGVYLTERKRSFP